MKKIDKLVLRSFLGPFLLSSFIALLILDMQFLWKYVDDLVGKGLSLGVIGQLVIYYSANVIPLAVPLGILLAGIMTFGNLGESYQLTALKSSGISLVKFMRAAVFATLVITMGTFVFSNYFLPQANLKFISTLFSIYQKKPTVNIQDKAFYQDIPGYTIRIGEKDEDGIGIKDVRIYDHSGNGESSVITAEAGEMQMTEDERYLVLKLLDGEQYQEMTPKEAHQKPNEHIRTRFEEYKMVFDLSSFEFENSDEDIFKNNYSVLTMGQLKRARDSVKRAVGKQDLPYYQSLNESLSVLRDTGSLAGRTMPPAPKANRFFETIPDDHKLQVLTKAKSRARNQTRYAGNIESIKANMQVKVRRYQMEVWRKFSMPFTCLVFIMVGAPLGAIIRKGGFGLPIIISVVIFVVYWIIIITCEKLGKKGTLSPFMAMWLANLVILPLGFFLSYKAMNDSAVLNLEVYKERFQKLIQRLGFK